ncbi:MAG: hypothetical protein PHR44_07445 [Candidatus Omnitrophica bacterium]|nr:hypothetical protein [Candidatus Omnitrophota bacterium]
MGLFVLGRVVCTRGINDALADNASFAKFVTGCLKRHVSGDWGDMDEQDKRENEFAIGKYLRLFSSYNYRDKKIWIITEADRSSTCVLFPDEY